MEVINKMSIEELEQEIEDAKIEKLAESELKENLALIELGI